MKLPWIILTVVSVILLSTALFCGALEFNSIQEYILTFEQEPSIDVTMNATYNFTQQKQPQSLFKTSPLLSMFPGSPSHIEYNGSAVGNPLILTPFIENGDIATARNLSKVDPNFSEITSYTGFFTVNKKYNSNLFFWFVPAQVNFKILT